MNKARSVPSSRLARFGKLTSLASKVATNVLADSAKRVVKRQTIDKQTLLLSPKNLEQVAQQLSHLRGAAMKLGQLMSMDAGEVLSPELSALLQKLRSDALPMPHKQLVNVLQAQWGKNWIDTLSFIDLRPFAAASIGQVHKGMTEAAMPLAIKVQYPGVAQSIQSDVDNVMSLLKLTGLLPKHLDLSELVEEAKKQLLDEANYLLEAEYMQAYYEDVKVLDGFVVPKPHLAYCTDHILVMDYINAEPVEAQCHLSGDDKSSIVARLILLFFYELFEFKRVQTDPNFANFQYQPEQKNIVLLDFGATRTITDSISDAYFELFNAAIEKDKNAVTRAAKQIGYFDDSIQPQYLNNIIDLFMLACEPLRLDEEYSFKNSNLAKEIKDRGMAMSAQKDQWHTPPVDALFIHRKLAGLYLLGAKLDAKVNVNRIFTTFCKDTEK